MSLVFAAAASAEADIDNGRVLADTCKGCHAVDSYNNVYPTYHVPRIGGQSVEYLEAALKLYRSGDRPHPTMQAQAAAYSDAEIRDIAAYLASVVEPLAKDTPAVGAAPAAAMICSSCHGARGVGEIASYPYLAGQHQDYLQHSLGAYKAGTRKGVNGTIMQAQVMNLSEQDIVDIAAFYAAQSGLTALPME
jgi:cytochrome c553